MTWRRSLLLLDLLNQFKHVFNCHLESSSQISAETSDHSSVQLHNTADILQQRTRVSKRFLNCTSARHRLFSAMKSDENKSCAKKRSIKMVKIKDVKNQKSRVFISLIGITSSAVCGQYYTRPLLLLHRFNCLFSRKTWVSRHQKGKTGLDLNDVYQLDHMQTVCA